MDASIIMLQKVAAMVDKVAAYLHFIACEMRWILIKIFLALAASSADFLCASIYYSNAVSSAFCCFCAEDWRNWRKKWYIQQTEAPVLQELTREWFFWKEFVCAEYNAEDCAESEVIRNPISALQIVCYE